MTPSNDLLPRREFLKQTGKTGISAASTYLLLSQFGWLTSLLTKADQAFAANRLDLLAQAAPLARYWIGANSATGHCLDCHGAEEDLQEAQHHHRKNQIKCLLCAQNCRINEGERGRCRTRINRNGELRSLVYGRPIAIHTDPIEKKPFYHFLPGSLAYSLATSGCPLQCKFCQNWEISQISPEEYSANYTVPNTIVSSANENNTPIIAFTYNEPTVFIEYLTDIARAARNQQLRTVMISCGFMNPEPLTELCSVLDAIKIDLKGFSPDFYRTVCSAELAPVLKSIKQIAKSRTHLEIVNLVVPTLNDSDAMLTNLIDWLVGEIGVDVPLHFTRFHPDYQLLNLPPTPVATLERAREKAMNSGLHYVYVGNVPGSEGNHTYCPSCHKKVISREGFFVQSMQMKDGKCEYCREPIAGIWS